MPDDTTTYALAAGLGAVTGMRSMSAVAQLSRHLARHAGEGPSGAARWLSSRRVATVLTVLAAGETVVDKLPGVPDRTDPPALAGRAALGAFCGAAVAGYRGGSPWGSALLGAGAAVGAAFLAYRLRKEAGERSGVPDPVLALGEDAIVWSAGSRLASAV